MRATQREIFVQDLEPRVSKSAGGFDNYTTPPYLNVTSNNALLRVGVSNNGGVNVNTDARLRCRLSGCDAKDIISPISSAPVERSPRITSSVYRGGVS